MYMSKKNKEEHLNKAVSAGATRTRSENTAATASHAQSRSRRCGSAVCTRFRRRRSGLKGAAVLCTMQYRSSSRGGGKKTAQFFTVCRSVLGHHQLPIDISLPPASTTYQWAPVSVGSCRSVRPARCRSSSEVNVPVHDLQAVAVLRLRATVLAIFTRNTLAHPPLPRVHRAPIGPSAHRPIEHTARHDRNEARQPCPTPDSTPWHAAHATTPTRKNFQSPSRQRARGDPFDAPEPEESDSPLLPNLNACAHTALTTGVCRP